MSVISIQAKGKRIANLLFWKWNPEKRAILVIGAKFGGWGKSLVSIARINKPKTIFIFNLSNSINFKFGKTQ